MTRKPQSDIRVVEASCHLSTTQRCKHWAAHNHLQCRMSSRKMWIQFAVGYLFLSLWLDWTRFEPKYSARYTDQRWSRGHKARGQDQGQGHKKIRGQGQGQPFRGQNLSRPRTGMLEAKDRGHSRKRSPKKKVFKNIFQAISNSWAYPKVLIKEGLNHKSHEMTSPKFFQRKFLRDKDIVGWKIWNRCCLFARNQDFAKEEGLN